jgi:hypothetical protein
MKLVAESEEMCMELTEHYPREILMAMTKPGHTDAEKEYIQNSSYSVLLEKLIGLRQSYLDKEFQLVKAIRKKCREYHLLHEYMESFMKESKKMV